MGCATRWTRERADDGRVAPDADAAHRVPSKVGYPIAGGTDAAVRDVSLDGGRAANASASSASPAPERRSCSWPPWDFLPGVRAPSGSVRFEGEEILGLAPRALNRIRGSKLTMIFQDPMTSLTPHVKIGVQLAEVLVHHRGVPWRDAERAALEMLDRVRDPRSAAPARAIPA